MRLEPAGLTVAAARHLRRWIREVRRGQIRVPSVAMVTVFTHGVHKFGMLDHTPSLRHISQRGQLSFSKLAPRPDLARKGPPSALLDSEQEFCIIIKNQPGCSRKAWTGGPGPDRGAVTSHTCDRFHSHGRRPVAGPIFPGGKSNVDNGKKIFSHFQCLLSYK